MDFLTEEEYKESAAAGAEELADEDRRDLASAEAGLRTFGLLGGDVDLVAQITQLHQEGTLAYYDPLTERVTVKGTELTEEVKATLVHELTHALQDQHFSLKALSDPDATARESEAAGFLHNLVEGDADRVENHWEDSQSEGDQKFSAQVAEPSDEADLEGVSDVLVAAFSTPYLLGRGLVEIIALTGGNSAVDAAFRSPPTSDEQIYDPFRYLAHDDPQRVAPPALKEGEEAIKGSEPMMFGSFMLFATLAQRLDPVAAMDAVDGWSGDQMVTFESDGRQCTRVHLAAADAAQRDEMQAALQKWVEGMPAGVASLARAGELIEFNSCDPGAGYAGAGVSLQDALAVPLSRANLAFRVMDMGNKDPDYARCYSGKFVREFLLEQMDAPLTQEAAQRMAGMAASCVG